MAKPIANKLAGAVIWIYKMVLSPWLPPACRFDPSCSDYAAQAFRQYGFTKAASLSLRRLTQCHPWGKSGYDPVPLQEQQERQL